MLAWQKWVLKLFIVCWRAGLALHSLLTMGKRSFSSMMRVPVRTVAEMVTRSPPLEENFMQDLSCSKGLLMAWEGRGPRCAHTHCVGDKLVVVDLSVRRPEVVKEELCGDRCISDVVVMQVPVVYFLYSC